MVEHAAKLTNTSLHWTSLFDKRSREVRKSLFQNFAIRDSPPNDKSKAIEEDDVSLVRKSRSDIPTSIATMNLDTLP